MDVKHACRCCLRCPPDKDLTTPYIHVGKTEIYADMIKQCFDIHLALGSGLCGICSACVGRLRDASDFKLQVQNSQLLLQETLLVKEEAAVKSELADDADEDLESDGLYEVPVTLELGMLGEDETGGVLDVDPLIKSEAGDDVAIDSTGSLMAEPAPASSRTLEGSTPMHNGEKLYACEHCGKHYRNKFILRKHIQHTHLSSEKHQRHTSEKLHKCSHCDYNSIRKSNLLAHERRHTGDKPYTCSYCDFKCSHKSTIRKHLMTHTNEPKKFKCSDCNYECSQKGHLQRHQMIHTGEKPFSCSHCDFKCSDKSSLKKHQMIHTGAKPFKCSHCGYECRQKSNLHRHQLKHVEKPF
ncbi:zinc finger protein 782-like isoform X2 [Cydia pomonella]|uniref:zinc finger protein 782-like isoform X2 n=1 Tax=Cydia pomonella TaxID=82600 RepID=UPI002ADE3ADA|nr:zinc finger protein 782-like isoform X2 [Cydia pomonella]